MADTHAERRECVFAAGLLKLTRSRQEDTRAGSAKRMPERDRTAIHVDPAVVKGLTETLEAGKNLCRKGFIYLYDVHIVDRKAGARQRLAEALPRILPLTVLGRSDCVDPSGDAEV